MSLTIFLSYKVAQKENRKETLERVNLLYPLKADTQLTKVFLLSHKLSFSKVQVLYINSPQNAYLLKKKKLIYKLSTMEFLLCMSMWESAQAHVEARDQHLSLQSLSTLLLRWGLTNSARLAG